MLRQICEIVFGVPFGEADRAAAMKVMAGQRGPDQQVEFLRTTAAHNTEKSGALLAAQGVYVVVDIFAIDHGWPRTPILVSLLLLVLGSLIVMTNLRGVFGAYRDPATAGQNPVQAIFRMVMWRTVRFNVALYLTFLSVILLGAVALSTTL